MFIFIKRCLLIFFVTFASGVFAKQYELALCSMFQNEAPYLKEWIEFHKLVGVEHFWLYNNNSTDNYKQVLKPYIESGLVELIEWPSETKANEFKNHTYTVQVGAFNNAIKKARKKAKWLAILDADEFLFSPLKDNVADVLNEHFSKCSGVYVNWQLFGTSHINSIKSNELMIEKLTSKAETNYKRNRLGKSIVRPKDVVKCKNPHYCQYRDKCFHVDTNKERVLSKSNGVLIDKLRINHYWVRDEDYLQNIKIPRYLKWNNSADDIINESSRLNAVYDGEILKFVEKMKKKMFTSHKK